MSLPALDPGSSMNASKHWSTKIRETTLSAQIQDGHLNIPVKGGADQGMFCILGEINHKKLVYWSGKLHQEDIILEVQGHKVSGYTLRDIRELIETLSRNGEPIMLKTCREGQLPKELRTFLSSRFKKGSADYDLQTVVRDNLYLRTVPCTTRPVRPGETPGVSYTFLTIDEFLALEKSGNLLESGVYEGNHYGTPKPSPEATGLIRRSPGSSGSKRSGGGSSTRAGGSRRGSVTDKGTDHNTSGSLQRRRRNKSTTEAVAPDTPSTNHKEVAVDVPGSDVTDSNPLPANWEIGHTESGHMYFIDHNKGSTQWNDPRDSHPASNGSDSSPPLPYGWEKVEDPKYGTFYIDHVRKRTQYERPTTAATELPSYAVAVASSSAARDSSLQLSTALGHVLPPVFVNDERLLRGRQLSTTLVKSPRGFGFTIVGGGSRDSPEFLQIKNVVAGGPAAVDGIMRTGDVLVRVEDRLILGFTHEDIVALFQQIPVGQCATLLVCRGYSLPFDPDDPDTHVITKVAVNLPAAPTTELKSPPRPIETPKSSADEVYFLPADCRPEFIKTSIVRSGMGFGFTIADSPHGQRIRQVLDRPRCAVLQEGDVLVEINNRRVKELEHSRVVEVLKECPVGVETKLLVQRGGLLAVRTSVSSSVGSPGSSGTGAPGGAPAGTPARAPVNVNGLQTGSIPRPSVASSVASSDMPPVHESHTLPRSATMAFASPTSVSATSSSNYEKRNEPSRMSRPTTPDLRFRSRTPGPETVPVTRVELPRRPKTPTGGMEARWRLGGNANQLPFNPAGTPDFVPASMLLRRSVGQGGGPRPLSSSYSTGSLPRILSPNKAWQELHVTLRKTELGFGFRIIGGAEEGSQVNIGHIVPNGAADVDGRIRQGDEIVSVDSIPVHDAAHRRVVELMEQAALVGRVDLGLRRRPGAAMSPPVSTGSLQRPLDVTVRRTETEGFGFVIISSVTRAGSSVGEFIGRIVEGSPAERCRRLKVGDRILAVNGVDISRMHHEDIVNIIKESGLAVTLTIGQTGQMADQSSSSPNSPITRATPARSSAGDSTPPPGAEFEVALFRGSRGFGFSIRGGEEFNQMPLFVLRIAEGGAAHQDGRLRVGDQILRINNRPTAGLTHAQAVEIIQSGGNNIRLFCRRPAGSTPSLNSYQSESPVTSSASLTNGGVTRHQQQVLYSAVQQQLQRTLENGFPQRTSMLNSQSETASRPI